MSSTPQSVREDKSVREEAMPAISRDQKPSGAQTEPTQTASQPTLYLPAEPNLASRLDVHGSSRVQTTDQLETARNTDISSNDLLVPPVPDSAPKKKTVGVIKAVNKPGRPEVITKEEDMLASTLVNLQKAAVGLGKVVRKQNEALQR